MCRFGRSADGSDAEDGGVVPDAGGDPEASADPDPGGADESGRSCSGHSVGVKPSVCCSCTQECV